MSDPSLYLGRAVVAMVTKATAPKNLRKATWEGWDRSACEARLREEIRELIAELDRPQETRSDEAILLEAADVIAFAAMLPDTDDRS